ncbi:LysR family transcriptional regulator [Streptomyces sp. NBC_01476]|uniref:LysR family transcriptional regulator n=1 Tax=Streptomyces sp. NBC_01476 TaxID=2903881 RepID=UPI002E33EA29|nr:LysR family transcriptional regulator [Streptomyces sp. NBC_01476]
MELRHLRHFVALAEERSFTRAAARELIVQSGLSTSVRALEKDVGTPLFIRGTRPVRLTVEGEALLPAARRALEAAEAARQAARDVHGVLAGRLVLGALQTSGHTLPFTSWLADFAVAHPGLDMSVRQLGALRMLDMVANGELDCALVSMPPGGGPPAGVHVVPILSESLALACSTGHPLAAAASVPLERLADERFVDTPPQWAIRNVIDDAFRTAGLSRRTVYEVNEWALVLDLVAAGAAVALVPEGLNFALHQDTAARMKLVPVEGVRLRRDISLALPKGQAASPAARRFLDHVVRAVRTPGPS